MLDEATTILLTVFGSLIFAVLGWMLFFMQFKQTRLLSVRSILYALKKRDTDLIVLVKPDKTLHILPAKTYYGALFCKTPNKEMYAFSVEPDDVYLLDGRKPCVVAWSGVPSVYPIHDDAVLTELKKRLSSTDAAEALFFAVKNQALLSEIKPFIKSWSEKEITNSLSSQNCLSVLHRYGFEPNDVPKLASALIRYKPLLETLDGTQLKLSDGKTVDLSSIQRFVFHKATPDSVMKTAFSIAAAEELKKQWFKGASEALAKLFIFACIGILIVAIVLKVLGLL